jgi:SAM-dependent methyltransferase
VKAEELHALARVEREHWFYRGKRKLVLAWMAQLGLPDGSDRWLVDVGAGTGILMSELEGLAPVVGVEYSPAGMQLARATTAASLVRGSAEAIPLADGMAQLVVALDVIEHLDDDRTAVAEMARLLAPGGYLILNVPAFMSLWSDWDVALGHRRRYTDTMLAEVVAAAGLELHSLAYTNSLAFLPIWLYRRWRTAVGSADSYRAEDGVPPEPINSWLEAAFVRPALWPGFRPPFGVSVLAVARRPAT